MSYINGPADLAGRVPFDVAEVVRLAYRTVEEGFEDGSSPPATYGEAPRLLLEVVDEAIFAYLHNTDGRRLTAVVVVVNPDAGVRLDRIEEAEEPTAQRRWLYNRLVSAWNGEVGYFEAQDIGGVRAVGRPGEHARAMSAIYADLPEWRTSRTDDSERSGAEDELVSRLARYVVARAALDLGVVPKRIGPSYSGSADLEGDRLTDRMSAIVDALAAEIPRAQSVAENGGVEPALLDLFGEEGQAGRRLEWERFFAWAEAVSLPVTGFGNRETIRKALLWTGTLDLEANPGDRLAGVIERLRTRRGEVFDVPVDRIPFQIGGRTEQRESRRPWRW